MSTPRALLALIVVLSMQQLSWAQDASGVPLPDYIAALKSQGIDIIYSSDLVHDDYTVADASGDAPTVDGLKESLQSYGLTLQQGPNGSFLIVQNEGSAGQLRVVVSENGSDVRVPGATVQVDGVIVGVSDGEGVVLISDLAPQPHELTVTINGVTVSELQVVADSIDETVVAVGIELPVDALPELVVTSSAYSIGYENTTMHTFLDRDTAEQLPDIGEEVLRPIERLPGVANGGITTRSYVRGGAANEQLIVLDGLRLYEPYHLKDFHTVASVIDQNAIEGLDFYSAGYSVRYGDRMSGVIDMRLRQASQTPQTELGISFFNTYGLSTGRFGGEGRGDWLFSFKRGNLDLLTKAINPDLGAPRYEDFMGHVGWEWSDRTYIAMNMLYSYDKISIARADKSEDASAVGQNRLLWFAVNTEWSSAVSSSTVLSITDISNKRNGTTNIPSVVAGQVADTRDFQVYGLEQDWLLAVNDSIAFNFGIDAKASNADYSYDSTLTIASPFDQIFDNQPQLDRSIRESPEGEQYAAYLELRWQALEQLIFDFGLRWDRQSYTTANADDQTSPRFNALYRISDRTEIRLGLGRYFQAQEINELQVRDGLTNFFAPQYADHAVVSFWHRFSSDIDLRVELYQKKYDSLIPRFENAFDSRVLLPELQIDRARTDATSATAKGAEITVSGEKQDGSFEWWAGYSWSSIVDRVGGVSVKRNWDQSHSIKGGFIAAKGQWDFSVAGAWHSGWPATELIVATIEFPGGSSQPFASTTPRNSLEYSSFHTVDARVSRSFQLRKSELTAYLEISNIYDRQNPCCIRYSVGADSVGDSLLIEDVDYWLPLVPTLGVVWRF